MRRDSLFGLAVFATVFLWQTGNSWGQAPPAGKTRSITGTVQEAESGTGVAGVTVKVKGTEATAVTGTDGTFTVDAPRTDVTLELTEPDHVTVEVVLPARQKSVQVAMTRAAPSERVVTGIVKEAGTGKPVASAVVTLKGTASSSTTDADGLFVLTRVPMGDAQLEVSSQAHQAAQVSVPAGQRWSSSLSAAPGHRPRRRPSRPGRPPAPSAARCSTRAPAARSPARP